MRRLALVGITVTLLGGVSEARGDRGIGHYEGEYRNGGFHVAKRGGLLGRILQRWGRTAPGEDGMTEPDGSHYEGETRNGVPHGQGVKTWPDGRLYEGEWSEGLMHGQGVLAHPLGFGYEGELRDGLMHGRGVYTTPDGQRYEGEWPAL